MRKSKDEDTSPVVQFLQTPPSPNPPNGKRTSGRFSARASNATNSQTVQNGKTDNELWEEAFAATTPEQLAHLEQMFIEEEKREGTMPLDFTGR